MMGVALWLTLTPALIPATSANSSSWTLRFQDDEFADVAGMSAGVSVSDGAAPIMADQENLLETKLAHELVNVGRDGALVITGRGLGRVAESAHVRCDHRVAFGERWDDASPFVPRLRPSVEQNDGVALARGDVMEPHVLERDRVMSEIGFGDHV